MITGKKQNAITYALTSVYGQMFPGGKQEEYILTTELYELLGGRIQEKIVNQALCCALSSILLFSAKCKEQVIGIMRKRFQNQLSLSEQDAIVEFAVAHNRIAALIFEEHPF